jgi:hypothetical protein
VSIPAFPLSVALHAAVYYFFYHSLFRFLLSVLAFVFYWLIVISIDHWLLPRCCDFSHAALLPFYSSKCFVICFPRILFCTYVHYLLSFNVLYSVILSPAHSILYHYTFYILFLLIHPSYVTFPTYYAPTYYASIRLIHSIHSTYYFILRYYYAFSFSSVLSILHNIPTVLRYYCAGWGASHNNRCTLYRRLRKVCTSSQNIALIQNIA